MHLEVANIVEVWDDWLVQRAHLVSDGHVGAQHGEDRLVVGLCGAHKRAILRARHPNLTLYQRRFQALSFKRLPQSSSLSTGAHEIWL